MEWLPFVEDCRSYFDAGRENSLFPLVEAVDRLYRIVPEKAPFPRSAANDQSTDSFDRCFFVCHRAFLSSAMLIAGSLPEDGEALTRRALEAAKTCLAIKIDPANGDAWLALEARLKRLRNRAAGRKPEPLHINYKKVKLEPLYQEVDREIGILSDFSVHFTPEFFGRYEWEEKPRPDGGFTINFGLMKGAVEMGFLMLCKHHELIIRVFDRCQDGGVLQNADVRDALLQVYESHDHYRQLVEPTLKVMIAELKP